MKLTVKTTKIISAHHVIFKPRGSVKCADGITVLNGTIESYPFTFDDVTVPNLCLCADVTVPPLKSFMMSLFQTFVCLMMSLFRH